jgi:hypothetical protein
MAGKGAKGHKGAKGGFKEKNAKKGATFGKMKGAKI